VEIGDNIEVEEVESDESSTRSPAARRKNGRTTAKAETENEMEMAAVREEANEK